MKLCKDCKHSDIRVGLYCVHPKCDTEAIEIINGTHFSHPMAAVAIRQRGYLCGEDAKWWEPKAIDPGEGWRMLNGGEEFKVGDEFTIDGGLTWRPQGIGGPMNNYMLGSHSPVRRRIVPALKRCPKGHESTMKEGTESHYYVECGDRCCFWRGDVEPTKEAAAKAWNEGLK